MPSTKKITKNCNYQQLQLESTIMKPGSILLKKLYESEKIHSVNYSFSHLFSSVNSLIYHFVAFEDFSLSQLTFIQ